MQSFIASFLVVSGALATPHQRRQWSPSVWQPAVGTKWQIVISQPVDTSQDVQPSDASVIDVDLFYTTAEDVASLKSQGKNVICYFSAGSSESWRPDYGSFPSEAIGEPLEGWEGENWLDIRNDGVLEVMKSRIDQASQKGCNAIDPDNMDGYGNGGGGFGLTTDDSANYLISMSQYAAQLGMSTGLKNAQEIISSVEPYVQFAVNEECIYVEESGCAEYQPLLDAGKAVFHIEYLDEGDNGSDRSKKARSAKARKGRKGAGKTYKKQGPLDLSSMCAEGGLGDQLSTVVKYLALDGFVEYCDGSTADTAINENYNTGDPKQGGDRKHGAAGGNGTHIGAV